MARKYQLGVVTHQRDDLCKSDCRLAEVRERGDDVISCDSDSTHLPLSGRVECLSERVREVIERFIHTAFQNFTELGAK